MSKQNKKSKPKKASGRTDKKKNHPEFTANQVTEKNLQLFLKVFSEPHRLFVLEYTRSWNAGAAYSKIYPKANSTTARTQGHRLLQDKKVQLYLDYLASVKNEKYEFDSDDFNRRIRNFHDKASTDIPVREKIDGEWVETGEYKFDSHGVGKALDLEGKVHGQFTKKLEIYDGTGSIPHFMVHQLVVPQIRTINMADPKFKTEITEAVKEEIAARKKRR